MGLKVAAEVRTFLSGITLSVELYGTSTHLLLPFPGKTVAGSQMIDEPI